MLLLVCVLLLTITKMLQYESNMAARKQLLTMIRTLLRLSIYLQRPQAI